MDNEVNLKQTIYFNELSIGLYLVFLGAMLFLPPINQLLGIFGYTIAIILFIVGILVMLNSIRSQFVQITNDNIVVSERSKIGFETKLVYMTRHVAKFTIITKPIIDYKKLIIGIVLTILIALDFLSGFRLVSSIITSLVPSYNFWIPFDFLVSVAGFLLLALGILFLLRSVVSLKGAVVQFLSGEYLYFTHPKVIEELEKVLVFKGGVNKGSVRD